MPKPQKGQVWRRKKDSMNLLVVGTQGDGMFRTVNMQNRKVQHHVLRKTLWMYYTLVGTEEKHD